MIYRQPAWKIYACQFAMTRESEGKENSKSIYFSVNLIQADCPDEAFSKAESCISRLGDRYKDDNGDIIHEACIGIHNIELLQVTWGQLRDEANEDEWGYTVCNLLYNHNVVREYTLAKREELSIFAI